MFEKNENKEKETCVCPFNKECYIKYLPMSGFKGGDCPILIKPSGHTDWGAWVAEQYHT